MPTISPVGQYPPSLMQDLAMTSNRVDPTVLDLNENDLYFHEKKGLKKGGGRGKKRKDER